MRDAKESNERSMKNTDDCAHCLKDGVSAPFKSCADHNRRLKAKNKHVSFDKNPVELHHQIDEIANTISSDNEAKYA